MPGFIYPTNAQPNAGQHILTESAQALMNLASVRVRNYKRFWANPIEVAAQLGTNAVAVFQADAALVAFLGSQLTAAGAPAEIIAAATAGIPAHWNVAYNADGSVTITAKS